MSDGCVAVEGRGVVQDDDQEGKVHRERLLDLVEWGRYWQRNRDRDELGYPAINPLHPDWSPSPSRDLELEIMSDQVQRTHDMVMALRREHQVTAWIMFVFRPTKDEGGGFGRKHQAGNKGCNLTLWKVQMGVFWAVFDQASLA